MQKFKIFFLASTIIGFFSLIGCSKSNNNNNNNSSSGKDSIYYSHWMDITMSPTDGGDTIYVEDISAAAVTRAVLDGGAVLSYVGEIGYPNAGDTTTTTPLEVGLYVSYTPGVIQLNTYGYLNDYSTNNTGLLYRYVVVPGTVLTTKGLTPIQLRSLSYTEVTQLLSPPGKQTASPTLQ